MAEDFVDHEVFPGIPPNRDGVRQFFELMRSALPGMRTTVERMIAEGDLVVAHATMRGTHRGEFMGVPASGNEVEFAMIDIVGVADNKLAEHWGVADMMAMMEQVGALQGEGAGAA